MNSTLDDRCDEGRCVHCPELNTTPRLTRIGCEDFTIQRTVKPDGTCCLQPIHPDGTLGQGICCRNGKAAHQIAKYRIEGE
jgi:hypothetical protein